MTEKRKACLCDEILDWASCMFFKNDLYEWARRRGMTDEEIQDEFYFKNDEMETFKEEYKRSYGE